MSGFGNPIGAAAVVLMLGSPTLGATFYAKPAGTGNQTCLSWTDACTLNQALSLAADTAYPDHDTIWVKSGTHVPIEWAGDSNITIIGGFAGTESSASQSNPATNVTTVDGGQSQRCADRSGPTSSTVLRGLRFANGYAVDEIHNLGGGALLLRDSSPKIVDCVFENNWAYVFGGAVSMWGDSSPEFVNCIFRYNGITASGELTYVGGAIYSESAYGWKAVNCLFHGNLAREAAAMYIASWMPTVLTNCTIADNTGTTERRGGGIYARYMLEIRNCILWGNRRVNPDDPNDFFFEQLYWQSGFLTVANTDMQGGWTGTGNIDADPLFGVAGGGAYLIPSSSPCKNAGSNAFLPLDVFDLDWDGNVTEVLPKDLQNLVRIRSTIVDMGAFEALAGGAAAGNDNESLGSRS